MRRSRVISGISSGCECVRTQVCEIGPRMIVASVRSRGSILVSVLTAVETSRDLSRPQRRVASNVAEVYRERVYSLSAEFEGSDYNKL